MHLLSYMALSVLLCWPCQASCDLIYQLEAETLWAADADSWQGYPIVVPERNMLVQFFAGSSGGGGRLHTRGDLQLVTSSGTCSTTHVHHGGGHHRCRRQKQERGRPELYVGCLHDLRIV